MNYVSKLVNFGSTKLGINPSTLTGAIDVLIVEQEDGTYLSSPFHVRFGKLGVMRPAEKVVEILINDKQVPLTMKLGEEGEAFFLESANDDEEVPPHLCASPIASAQDLTVLGSMPSSRVGERVGREREALRSGDQREVTISTGASINVLEAAMRSKSMDDIVTLADGTQQSANTEHMEWRWGQVPRALPANTSVEEAGPPISSLSDHAVSPCGPGSKDGALAIVPESQSSAESSKHANGANKKKSWWKWSSNSGSVANAEQQPASGANGAVPQPATGPAMSVSPPIAIPTRDAVQTELTVLCSSLPAALESGVSSAKDGQSQNSPVSSSTVCATATEGRNEIYLDELDDEKAKVFLYNVHKSPVDQTKQSAGQLEALMSGASSDVEPEWDGERRRVGDSSSEDESGRGSACSGSTIHSPASGASQAAAIKPPQADASDMLADFAFALCDTPLRGISDSAPPEFAARRITSFEEFLQLAASLVADERLVVRLGGRYTSWRIAAPIVLARLAFGDSVPRDVFARFTDPAQPQPITQTTTPTPNTKQTEQRKHWFSGWKRSATTTQPSAAAATTAAVPPTNSKLLEKASNGLTNGSAISSTAPQQPLSSSSPPVTVPLPVTPSGTRRHGHARTRSSSMKREALGTESSLQMAAVSDGEASMSDSEVLDCTRNPNTGERRASASESPSTTDVTSANNASQPSRQTERSVSKTQERCKKTLRLDSAQIARLNLRRGANKVTYSVTTQFQGTARCICYAYLWRYDDKIVISDIDGTITKSDALGHVMPRLPIIGNDWAQPGVAQLFTRIAANGYRFAYLSARAIGQSAQTREYLRSVRQGDFILPDGPVLLSPSSLLHAFHREVIEKRPEIFKIDCLRDIQQVFGQSEPLYAGFGNRVNDVFAYTNVGIDRARIFTVNSKAQVVQESLSQRVISGYAKLCELVDHLFPPLADDDCDECERHFSIASADAEADADADADVDDAEPSATFDLGDEAAAGTQCANMDDADSQMNNQVHNNIAEKRRRERLRSRQQLDAALKFNPVVYWRDPLPDLGPISP